MVATPQSHQEPHSRPGQILLNTIHQAPGLPCGDMLGITPVRTPQNGEIFRIMSVFLGNSNKILSRRSSPERATGGTGELFFCSYCALCDVINNMEKASRSNDDSQPYRADCLTAFLSVIMTRV